MRIPRGICVCISSCLSFLSQFLAVPFFVLTRVAMIHPEKPDNKLEFLRTVLSQDQTLFTAHRRASRPKGHIRVDCFASKGENSPGLTRITPLVAGVLKHRNGSGLTINNGENVVRNLVAALSKKLNLDLKHESLN